MSEYPVAPAVETAVLNPNVYLLRKGNKAFIERKIDYPILQKDYLLLAFGAMAVSTVVGVLGLIAVWAFEQRFVPIVLLVLGLELMVFFIAYQLFLSWEAPQQDGGSGWIIPGAVIEAETVKVHQGKYVRETIRIRYRFAAPSGVIEEAFIEATNSEANHIIAPKADTPIYVWYKDDGTYHLL